MASVASWTRSSTSARGDPLSTRAPTIRRIDSCVEGWATRSRSAFSEIPGTRAGPDSGGSSWATAGCASLYGTSPSRDASLSCAAGSPSECSMTTKSTDAATAHERAQEGLNPTLRLSGRGRESSFICATASFGHVLAKRMGESLRASGTSFCRNRRTRYVATRRDEAEPHGDETHRRTDVAEKRIDEAQMREDEIRRRVDEANRPGDESHR